MGGPSTVLRTVQAAPTQLLSIVRICETVGTLRLITFGLENCDSELINLGMDRGGAAFAEFYDEELREALARKQEPNVDLVLDARRFPDPGATHNTRHIGVHPEIIERIVRHWHFTEYLRDVRRKWREVRERRRLQSDRTTSMVIAVYCRSGKHRSIAVAECLKHIGQRVEGLRFNGRNDLSRPRWKNVCRGGCDECSTPSERKESALQHAVNIWTQL